MSFELEKIAKAIGGDGNGFEMERIANNVGGGSSNGNTIVYIRQAPINEDDVIYNVLSLTPEGEDVVLLKAEDVFDENGFLKTNLTVIKQTIYNTPNQPKAVVNDYCIVFARSGMTENYNECGFSIFVLKLSNVNNVDEFTATDQTNFIFIGEPDGEMH